MSIYIFEIVQPGDWIQHSNPDIFTILRNMVTVFYDANISLNEFHKCRQKKSFLFSQEQREQDTKRKSEISQKIKALYENPYDHSVCDDITLQTEIEFKKEQWKAGRIPREFEHQEVFIYARSFLYALDSFDKFLEVLKGQPNVPNIISDLHDQFANDFPDLRGVRNSAQHMEDRARGLGAKKKNKVLQPLVLKPIKNELISSKSGAIVLNCLNGNKYANTMADGHYGEVEVSPKSMIELQSILQKVLDSFTWEGSKSHLPCL